MSIRKKVAILGFCLATSGQNLLSQIVVQGVVTDTGSEPVHNALVTLTDMADSSRTFNDLTDDQGFYSIWLVDTKAGDSPSQAPGAFSLLQNYPNPFNPSTVIDYELAKPARIRIAIYNIMGQKVKTLFDGFQNSLYGRIVWDATDDFGRGVPAGVYIYSLSADGIFISKKMALVDGRQNSVDTPLSGSMAADAAPNKTVSDQYWLKITGDGIETHEEQNLLITANTTLDVTIFRTIIDIDGNVCRIVKIGNQWWMAQNLKVTHYRNGDPIPNMTGQADWGMLTYAAYCNYSNNTTLGAVYGRLYNTLAVRDSRGIAPEGWHVASDADFQDLEMFLGMASSDAGLMGWRGTDEGGELKESGTLHWDSPNTGATNASLFCALPGGYRGEDGQFADQGSHALFWTMIESDSLTGLCRQLQYDEQRISRGWIGRKSGLSVRCVKGVESPLLLAPADHDTIDTRRLRFDWSDVSGASIYELIIDYSSDFSDPDIHEVSLENSEYTPPYPLSNAVYYWKVRCKDTLGNWSRWSSPWEVTINAPGAPPPILLAPIGDVLINTNFPTLDWSDSYGVTDYQIVIDNNRDFNSWDFWRPEIESSEFWCEDFLPDNRYYWKVRAEDSTWVYGEFSQPDSFRVSTAVVDFVFVQGGTFQMGDAFGDGEPDETPVHDVTLRSFCVSKYEVTQEVFRSVMATNPSHVTDSDAKPVEQVAWLDAVRFCNDLSLRDGLTPCYTIDGTDATCDFEANGYRLGTEAEWEYAAKGGNQSQGTRYSGSNTLDDVGWFLDNAQGSTRNTGTKAPNELGVYDMSGNVSEWVWDRYGDYGSEAQTDPAGPSGGSQRISRSGDVSSSGGFARTTARTGIDPSAVSPVRGFRLFRNETQLLGAPVLLLPWNNDFVADSRPFFDWKDVDGAVVYELAVSQDEDFQNLTIHEENLSASEYFPPWMNLQDHLHFWKVRCRSTLGPWSAWSGIWRFTIDTQGPPAPILETPADGCTKNIRTPYFDWKGVSGAATYEFILDNDADFSSPEIDRKGLAASNYTPSDPLQDGLYYWKVRGKNAAGHWGRWSGVWSFRIAWVDSHLVLVQGGTFQMGSTGDFTEKPVHSVTLRNFYVSKYEVTQNLYQQVAGSNPSWFTADGNNPVEKVSWFAAVNYCNARSQLEGLTPCYTVNGTDVTCDFDADGYRLGTEAEWEYAARGGDQSQGYEYSGSNTAEDVAWYMDNSGTQTHIVGMKSPNELGLYDMSGNVWEWCWDWYGYYSSEAQTDPMGPSSGSQRVVRGGSFDRIFTNDLTVSKRSAHTADTALWSLGFRLFRTE